MLPSESTEKQKVIHEITRLTSGFMPAQIVLTANRMDLFSKLSGSGLYAENLARTLRTDKKATELLCNALCALGFLKKENEVYKNSKSAEEFLVTGQPYYIGDSLKHQANLLEKWLHLGEVIKTGKAIPKEQENAEKIKEHSRQFSMAMANVGHLTAQQVVDGLDLRSVTRLIDIGGGAGIYATEFVKKNESIHATIFDKPEVISVADEIIRQSGMPHRISTISGDCFTDDLGSGYDLAFLSNIVHIYGLEEITILFKKIHKVLNPNGRIVVKDFFVNENRTGPPFATQFALNMLLSAERGNVYAFSEINHAFSETGFDLINSFDVGAHSKVIIGAKID